MKVSNRRSGLAIKDVRKLKRGHIEIQKGYVVLDGKEYNVEEPVLINAGRLESNTVYNVYLVIEKEEINPLVTKEKISKRNYVQLGSKRTEKKSVLKFWRGADFIRPEDFT